MGEPLLSGDGLDARLPGRRLLKAMADVGGECLVGQFLPAVGVLAKGEAHALDGADGLDLQIAQYPSGDEPIDAYFALPKGEAKHPAVVVIHDDAGLDEGTRSMARRRAIAGSAALAPDLLSRRGGSGKVDPGEVAAAINQQSLAGSVDDLQFTVNLCASTPSDGLTDVAAPVLAHYAQLDFPVTGNALRTANAMKGFGKRFTCYVYSHVSHSFFDSKNPRCDASPERLAWARTLEFLRSPA